VPTQAQRMEKEQYQDNIERINVRWRPPKATPFPRCQDQTGNHALARSNKNKYNDAISIIVNCYRCFEH